MVGEVDDLMELEAWKVHILPSKDIVWKYCIFGNEIFWINRTITRVMHACTCVVCQDWLACHIMHTIPSVYMRISCMDGKYCSASSSANGAPGTVEPGALV